MATETGVWDLQDVRDKQLASEWSYASAGMLFVWGNNEYGELGLNNETSYSSPVQVPGSWSRYGAGGRISLMVNTSGELWSAGLNEYGALGQNSTTQYSSPVQVPGTTWANVVCVGQYEGAFGTKTDGTLWAWGRNSTGESIGVLGQNSHVNYSSPVQVGSETTWSTNANHLATTGNGSVHAIKTDGTYWCWGYQQSGQLGQNSDPTTWRSSPVQIPGTTWAFVGTKGPNGCGGAIKTDGTLWTWGQNQAGALGHNNKTEYSSPKQLPGTTWSTLSAGGHVTLAIKTDGTLWGMGNNQYGGLGQNDTVYRSSPVQISGTTWSFAMTSAVGAYVTKTDGTLWTWGHNQWGNLGQNNTTNYSSPIQVPGDWDVSKIRLSWDEGAAAISAVSS